jgi:ribosome biogenesis GTPase A
MNENKTNINWYPGHMAKTKREIKEKLDLIDIVYEVIDSRMPKSSRIADLDSLIGNKPRIMIFTKYDLCDRNITDKFINEYEKNNVVIKTNLKENSNITKDIISKTEELLKSINEKRIAKGLNRRNYRALVVGVPNVGKSTLINRLAGRNVCDVANRAGVTKNVSWIKLNKDIELLDTPGILWPKIDDYDVSYNLASLTSIKEEILNKDDIAVYIIKTLYKYYPNLLNEKYGITDISDIITVLDTIGRKRGCLMRGNEVDYDKVYTIIINDLKEGKIGKVTFDR